MSEKSRKQLKSIVISEVVFLLNKDTTDEQEVTMFCVKVNDGQSIAEEVFESFEAAEAYASDVATRKLHQFDFQHMLDLR